MAQEETNEQNAQPEGREPAATPEDETAAREAGASAGEQEAEAEAPEAEESASAEAGAGAAGEGGAAGAEPEPEEELSPKERRKRERSRHSGEARPPRDPAVRASERAEARRSKAVTRRAWRDRQREKRRAGERGPARTEPVAPEGRAAPRVRQGVVVSDRADKTITVRIDVTRRHRAYKKIVRESSTLHAHDERNDAGVGDTVRVVESRPLSRSKRWRLVDVLERAR